MDGVNSYAHVRKLSDGVHALSNGGIDDHIHWTRIQKIQSKFDSLQFDKDVSSVKIDFLIWVKLS